MEDRSYQETIHEVEAVAQVFRTMRSAVLGVQGILQPTYDPVLVGVEPKETGGVGSFTEFGVTLDLRYVGGREEAAVLFLAVYEEHGAQGELTEISDPDMPPKADGTGGIGLRIEDQGTSIPARDPISARRKKKKKLGFTIADVRIDNYARKFVLKFSGSSAGDRKLRGEAYLLQPPK